MAHAHPRPIDLDKTKERLLNLSAQVQGLTLNFCPPSPKVDPPSDVPSPKRPVGWHRRACSGGSISQLGIMKKDIRANLSMDLSLHPNDVPRHPISSASLGDVSSLVDDSQSSLDQMQATLSPEANRFFRAGSMSPKSSSPSTESLFDTYINEQKQSAKFLTVNGKQYPAAIADLAKNGHLGHGISGLVVKMRHTPTGTMMAVKILQRNGNDEEQKRVLMDLYVTINLAECPSIVRYYGAIIDNDEAYICMEMMDTCLDKLMKKYKKPFPEAVCANVAQAVVGAMSYLKEKYDIMHRDIKPSNILLDAERGVFKICDFGISGHLVNSQACTRDAGCTAYMAPERFMPATAAKYDVRADVWSMGITLVELASAHFPYRNCASQFEVLTRILDEPSPVLPAGFSPLFQVFISLSLAKDVEKRPRFRDLARHEFINRQVATAADVSAWYRSLVG